MDENKEFEQERVMIENSSCRCSDHKILKCILAGLLIFLGAFAAAYTLLDWHMKAIFRHRMMPRAKFERIERSMQNDIDNMNRVMIKNEKILMSSKVMALEETKDSYIVKVDLKPFNNNPENVKISIRDNILTVDARNVSKTKYGEQISRFQHNYEFDKKVDLDRYNTEVVNNHLIITIPVVK